MASKNSEDNINSHIFEKRILICNKANEKKNPNSSEMSI